MTPTADPGGSIITGNTAYRFAVGTALVAALILVWLSLGVGIIGRDGDPARRPRHHSLRC
jgi:hypothetical protein